MLQALRTGHELHPLPDTDGRVGNKFTDVFIYRNYSFTYINAGSYYQLLHSNAKTDARGSLVLRRLSIWRTLIYFH